MITRRLASASLLLIGIAASATAKGKPDFSGEWIGAASASVDSSVARGLTVRQLITRANARGGPIEPFFSELVVVRAFADHTQTDSYQLGLQGGIVGGGGAQTRYSVRWEGNRLVIETGIYSGSTRQAGPYTEHTEEWELDAAGMLVLSMTNRSSNAEPSSDTLRYRRK